MSIINETSRSVECLNRFGRNEVENSKITNQEKIKIKVLAANLPKYKFLITKALRSPVWNKIIISRQPNL